MLQVINLSGFPGGSVANNPPANVGDAYLNPGWGGSHMPRSTWATAPRLLSLCSRAHEAQVLSPNETTTEARATRVHAARKEATAMSSPHTTTRK